MRAKRTTSLLAVMLAAIMTLWTPLAAFAEDGTDPEPTRAPDRAAYSVSYEYSNADLPDAVNNTLPKDTEQYQDGAVVTAKDPSSTRITDSHKVYTFNGWDSEQKTIDGADITFTGEWEVSEITYSIQGILLMGSTPLKGEDVNIELDSGEMALTTDNEGRFSFSFASTEDISEDNTYKWNVKATEEHHGAAGTLEGSSSEETPADNRLTVDERRTPSADDYEFCASDSVKESNGQIWVKEPGNYRIKGTGTKKLTETLDGDPSAEIEITVSEDGEISPFYVYDNNLCSKVLTGQKVKIDTDAPEILSVTISAANGKTKVKEHGVYSKEKAEIIVETNIKEDCGLKEVYLLVYDSDGNKTRYDVVRTIENGKKYEVAIGLPEEETLMDARLAKLVAVDSFGRKSNEVLIAQSEDGSRVTLEQIAPTISVSDTGNKSEYGWYSELPAISATASDAHSGLAALRIKGNGVDISEEYTGKVNDEKTVSGTASFTDESENGTYKYDAEAEDNAGNIATKTISVKIDLTAPKIDAEGIKNGGYYAEAPEITVTEDEAYYSEEGNRITVTVNKNGAESYNKTFTGKDSVTLDTSIFSEDAKYELKIKAKDAADNESETKTFRFVKDSSAPAVKKTVTGKKSEFGWYSELPKLSVSAEDQLSGLKNLILSGHGASAEDSYPENTFDAQTVSMSAKIDEVSKSGSYTYDINAENNAGVSAEDSIKVKIDLKKPSISADGVENGGYYSEAPEITLNENEQYSDEKGNRIFVKVRKDGRNVYDKTFEKKDTVKLSKELFKDDASYELEIKAKDAADNESATRIYKFIKDQTGPHTEITHNGEVNKYGWLNKIPTVKASAKDSLSGLTDLAIIQDDRDDPEIEKSYKGTFEEKSLSTKADLSKISENGKYKFTVKAKDRAGNTGTSSIRLKIDTVAPELKGSGIKSDAHYITVPAFTLNEKEQHYDKKGSFIKYKIRKKGSDNTLSVIRRKTDNVEIPSSSYRGDGIYTVTAYAKDAAGNKSNVVKRTFVKDATAPVISISGANEGAFYNKPVSISVRVREHNYATDKVTVGVTRKLGNGSESIGFPWKNQGEDSVNSRTLSTTGTYTVTASAVDKAGNRSQKRSLSFTVDTQAPVITINGVTDGAVYTYDQPVNPSATVTDDYLASKSISYTKAGETLTDPSFEQIKENDGLYTMTVTATDKAGNTSTKQVTFTVNRFGSHFIYDDNIKDLMGKAVKEVGGDLVITEKNLSRVTKTENRISRDGSSVDGSVKTSESGEKGDYTYRHIFEKGSFDEEGAYEINVISKDEDGNEMESREENGKILFYVDRTEPTLTVEGIDPKGIKGSQATITVKAGDLLTGISDVKATVDGNEVNLTEGEDSMSFTVGEGMQQDVRVTATDNAGNEAVYEDSVSVSESAAKLWLNRFGKYLLGGTGALALLGGGAFLIGKRRKDDDDEEEEEPSGDSSVSS